MFCKNCGAENKEGSKFCTSCGTELVVDKKKTTKEEVKEEKKEEKVVEAKPVQPATTKTSEKVTDGKATASLVLGICSFVIFCLMWPLSLIGMILGLASKERSGKRTAGVVINITALVLSTLATIMVFLPFGLFSSITTTNNTKNFFEQLEEKLEEIEDETKEEVIETKDVKKVGDDTYGYVEVPNAWLPFKDVDATTKLIQYTDIGEGGYIVTLNVYEENVEPYQAAQNLNNHIKEEGNSSYYLTTYVAGYRGYVVHATYTDGTYLDIYLFKANDDKLHYVAIEGPDKYNDNFDIPKTFTMEK